MIENKRFTFDIDQENGYGEEPYFCDGTDSFYVNNADEMELFIKEINELVEKNKKLKYKYDEQSNEKMGLEESIEELLKENKELKKQIEDLYENDKSLRKMMSGMSLNYQGITVHRSLYSEVLKILKENGAEDLYADLEKTSIDTLINGC